MELKDQVCSLELAQKLKELEVKQESYFRWHDEGKYGAVVWRDDGTNVPLGVATCAAFTVAELGEMLPESMMIFKTKAHATLRNSGGRIIWNGWTDEMTTGEHGISMIADTEADVRAKILIYLLEHKLLPN